MTLTIKEIKERLHLIEDIDDPFLVQYKQDERKGVQTALKQWYKQYDAREAIKTRYKQMNYFEQEGFNKGYSYIAGVDEVGRGPLAGPVVAAAVILDQEQPILGLNDSKKLSEITRNELCDEIYEKAIAVNFAVIDASKIDELNILQASKTAMVHAVKQLKLEPDGVLVDAETIDIPYPQKSLIKGDLKSNSIAAASIIAKVTRDALMRDYDKMYPGYGFANNVGYGTKEHLMGLENLGPTPIHRKSFAPVAKYF